MALNSGSDLSLCRAIFRDLSVYPEPDAFKPERFLNPDGSLRDDPRLSSAFGYGKRICPGRHFVDTTLFIYAASLLSIFLIKKVDKEGQSEYRYTGSILRKVPRQGTKLNGEEKLIARYASSHPESFSCSITPRDKRAEELIIADAMAR